MRIRLIAVLILAALLLCGCSAAEELHPPFFVVTDEQTGGRVYLLGSMHVGEKNARYPAEVTAAINAADIVACEVDTVALAQDSKRLAELRELLLCPEGNAADCFGDGYDAVAALFKEHGIDTAPYEPYLPAMWSSALSNRISFDCGLYGDYGTEQLLLSYAKSRGKPIYEIESAEEQYALNAALPMSVTVYSLVNSANTPYSEQLRDMQALYDEWRRGDTNALSERLNFDLPKELAEDYTRYYAMMYTERQRRMADYVIDALRSGESVFVIVGAMHYVAEPSIITLIEEAGYTAMTVDI